MAHEISIREDGTVEAAFASTPWHGLGHIANKLMSPLEALNESHLDWEVKVFPLYYSMNEKMVIAEDVKCVRRTDSGAYLGSVGKQYHPVQNREQAEFLEALVGEGGNVEAVGALFGGKKIFWTVKVPGTVQVSKKDTINKYIIIYNAHDGSSSFRVFWSPIRVVCNNTLNAALRKRQDVRDGFCLRHTRNIQDRIEDAKKALGIASEYYDELQDSFLKMAATAIGDDVFDTDFLPIVFPERKNDKGKEPKSLVDARSKVRLNWNKGVGSTLAGRTAWGAYNAVTSYTSHQLVPRSKTEKLDRRFDSIFAGTARDLQQKAFDTALTLCENN